MKKINSKYYENFLSSQQEWKENISRNLNFDNRIAEDEN